MPSDVPAVMNTRSAAIGKPLRRVLGGDRFARGRDAGRRPVVVVAVAHRALDRGDEMRRRLEAEGDRIADVEVAHARAGGLDLLRFRDDVADGVGEAVDAGGGRDGRLSLGGRHRDDLTRRERGYVDRDDADRTVRAARELCNFYPMRMPVIR